MASLALLKRLEAIEAAMGAGTSLAVGRVCPICQAHVALDDAGPCQAHRPLQEAEKVLLVTFHTPHAEP